MKKQPLGSRDDQSFVQQTNIGGQGRVQQVMVRPGEQVVIGGYQQSADSSTRRRLDDKAPMLMGGSDASQEQQLLTVVLKVARRTSYRLVAIPGSPNQLVFGLKWRTVLGEDLQKLALQAARKAKATHYVQTDARSSSVGLVTAKGSETRAKTRATLFSGAAAFAQMHRHGAHVVACTLPDQSVWLGVVNDGVVQTGGDTIFPDQAAAKNALDEVTARYRDHQLHSNYITQARVFSLQQLTAHVNAQSALRRASFRLSMVSPIWWVLVAAVLAYEAWDYGSTCSMPLRFGTTR
ncbi:hypothetical protein G6F68_011726 [Rhizopus microsporus]|nr:hypothetical protein G6F68_011726 [Rhizopus microsporus]